MISVVDKLWLKPSVAYCLIYLLPDDVKKIITELQNNILEQCPDNIRPFIQKVPLDFAHITIYGFVDVRHDYGRDKHQIWNEISKAVISGTEKILKDTGTFDLSFNEVAISPAAIFIKSPIPEQLYIMRQRLHNELPIPAECNQIIDIAHSSILKFTQEFELNELEKITKSMSIDIKLPIKHLEIASQTIYPFVNCDIIKRISF